MRRTALAVLLALGLGVLEAGADPPAPPAPQEQQQGYTRPSGFWTSPLPSKQPYRWNLMYIGIGLLVVTGAGMWRLVRRANLERAKRESRPLGQ